MLWQANTARVSQACPHNSIVLYVRYPAMSLAHLRECTELHKSLPPLSCLALAVQLVGSLSTFSLNTPPEHALEGAILSYKYIAHFNPKDPQAFYKHSWRAAKFAQHIA